MEEREEEFLTDTKYAEYMDTIKVTMYRVVLY